jgi:hypothetical protein
VIDLSIERKTIIFENPGKEHTEETLKIAMEGAKERGIDTVLVSSTTGYTAEKAAEIFKESQLNLIIVTHQTGYRDPGVQLFPDDLREKLEQQGINVLTCTDVLTGTVDVGMARQRPSKTEPLEARLPYILPPPNVIIANTLRLFSQGVKVCLEITMMAVDSNVLQSGKQVVVVAGSHAGADTAMVLIGAESSRIRDVKLQEILCKPL